MSRNMNVHLFIVDPQNDFMGNDDGSPYTQGGRSASLAVAGAVADMDRVTKLINRVGRKLTDIHVTLDSHHTIHVAHPEMWKDANGKPPGPFTLIMAADVGTMWFARNPAHQRRLKAYVETLESSGQFLHCIWPPHCRIGDWGHNVYAPLHESLTKWEREYLGVVNYVTKGSSVWTEHFGALEAQVPDPTDPSTQLNAGVIEMLREADMVGFVGEAKSHCVKTTVEQVAKYIGGEHVKKLVLLTDCMSSVGQPPGGPDFPAIGDQFLRDMQARGMTLMTANDFLA